MPSSEQITPNFEDITIANNQGPNES